MLCLFLEVDSLVNQGDYNILNHLLAVPQVLANVQVPVASGTVVVAQSLGTINVGSVDAGSSNLQQMTDSI